MFQDESVKTILTGSHVAPRAATPPTFRRFNRSDFLRCLCGVTAPSGLTLSPPLRRSSGSAPSSTILLYRFLLNGFRSFNILSKLLFIFPSQYLFAIGFPHLFSLRRSLSPALCTSIKVHDSSGPSRTREDTTDGALTLFGGPLVDTSAPPLSALATVLQITIRRPLDRRLPVWAFPASVARTKGILVSFFSSA